MPKFSMTSSGAIQDGYAGTIQYLPIDAHTLATLLISDNPTSEQINSLKIQIKNLVNLENADSIEETAENIINFIQNKIIERPEAVSKLINLIEDGTYIADETFSNEQDANIANNLSVGRSFGENQVDAVNNIGMALMFVRERLKQKDGALTPAIVENIAQLHLNATRQVREAYTFLNTQNKLPIAELAAKAQPFKIADTDDINALRYVSFYDKDQPFYELTNFYAIKNPIIGDDGITYQTSEHYFQAQKFSNLADRERIARQATPGKAMEEAGKLLAEKIPDKAKRGALLQEQWHGNPPETGPSAYAMFNAVLLKMKANPDLAQKLLLTGDAFLVEDTWHHPNNDPNKIDEKWGIGPKGTGINMLGLTLMQVREYILENEKRNGGDNQFAPDPFAARLQTLRVPTEKRLYDRIVAAQTGPHTNHQLIQQAKTEIQNFISTTGGNPRPLLQRAQEVAAQKNLNHTSTITASQQAAQTAQPPISLLTNKAHYKGEVIGRGFDFDANKKEYDGQGRHCIKVNRVAPNTSPKHVYTVYADHLTTQQNEKAQNSYVTVENILVFQSMLRVCKEGGLLGQLPKINCPAHLMQAWATACCNELNDAELALVTVNGQQVTRPTVANTSGTRPQVANTENTESISRRGLNNAS